MKLCCTSILFLNEGQRSQSLVYVLLKNTKSFYHPYFFSSRHAEHSLRLQLFWPSYYTKYILNLPKHILNILCSYSKDPFKFCQSENFAAGSHFYILLFWLGLHI